MSIQSIWEKLFSQHSEIFSIIQLMGKVHKKSKPDPYPYHIIFFFGTACFTLLIAFTVAFMRRFSIAAKAEHLILHRRVFPPCDSRINRPSSDTLIGAIKRAFKELKPLCLCELTYGELYILASMFSICAVWTTYGVHRAILHGHGAWLVIAKGLGYLPQMLLVLFFITPTRNSMWTWIFGSSFERTMKLHRLLSVIFYLAITIHGIVYIPALEVSGHSWSKILEIKFENFITPKFIIGGILAWISFTLMIACAIFRHAFASWVMFKISHWIFGIPGVVFSILHMQHFYWIPVFYSSLCLWLADRCLRAIWFMMPAHVSNIQYDSKTDIIQLNIETSLLDSHNFHPGQFFYVWMPSASLFHMSPFSVSRIEKHHSQSLITLFIKVTRQSRFSFTGRLKNVAQKVEKGNYRASDLWVRIEGPYGRTSVDPRQYEQLLLVAGGIGVTPMLSLISDCIEHRLKNSIEDSNRDYVFPRKIKFIWSVQSIAVLNQFKSILAELISLDSNLLDVELCVTREEHVDEQYLEEWRNEFEDKIAQLKEQMESNLYRNSSLESNTEDELTPFTLNSSAINYSTLIKIQNNSIDYQNDQDNSRLKIHPNRPRLKVIFDDLIEKVQSSNETGINKKGRRQNSIGVFTCGPISLVDAVAGLCWSHSKDSKHKIIFDLSQELFEM